MLSSSLSFLIIPPVFSFTVCNSRLQISLAWCQHFLLFYIRITKVLVPTSLSCLGPRPLLPLNSPQESQRGDLLPTSPSQWQDLKPRRYLESLSVTMVSGPLVGSQSPPFREMNSAWNFLSQWPQKYFRHLSWRYQSKPVNYSLILFFLITFYFR